jgi:hypothetical protein
MSNESHNDRPDDVPNSANNAADPLDLLFQKIDEHGLDHAEVENLANEHPELQEYLDFAREQEKEAPKKKQRALIVGTVFSGVLCAMVALVILGVYRNLQLPIVEKELASAQLSLEYSSSKATELERIVKKQAVDLKLYASAKEGIENAKEEIEKELASARLSLEERSSKATELERIVKKQAVDLKFYANAKEEIEKATLAREEAITAAKKADLALVDSKKQVKSLEEARNTAVKALNQTDEALKLALSNHNTVQVFITLSSQWL